VSRFLRTLLIFSLHIHSRKGVFLMAYTLAAADWKPLIALAHTLWSPDPDQVVQIASRDTGIVLSGLAGSARLELTVPQLLPDPQDPLGLPFLPLAQLAAHWPPSPTLTLTLCLVK
jgi:hypothetical protein